MTTETHEQHAPHELPDWAWYTGVPLAPVAWWLLYGRLIPFSDWATSLLPVEHDSQTGKAIAFFIYDAPKVLLLLTGIVFVTGMLRSWSSPERTRAILAGRNQVRGYPLDALLGVLSPFCSCSSVPLFIGVVSAGIPLGVTFSFVIAGQIVGPVGPGCSMASSAGRSPRSVSSSASPSRQSRGSSSGAWGWNDIRRTGCGS